jgi:hypothetical protein
MVRGYRCRNHDGFDRGVDKQIVKALIARCAGVTPAKILQSLRGDVAKRDQFGFLAFLQIASKTRPPVSKSNDGDPHGLHCSALSMAGEKDGQ